MEDKEVYESDASEEELNEKPDVEIIDARELEREMDAA